MRKKKPKEPLSVEELAEGYKQGRFSLDYALIYLLQHYFPEPLSVVSVMGLKIAIGFANVGHWDTPIPLPTGQMTVRMVIQEFGLEPFLQPNASPGDQGPT